MNTVPKQQIKLTESEERLTTIMRALGDETRFKIFKLMQSGSGMCVSEIADVIGVSVPAVSQHFRTFELIGLVDKTRTGQKICYKLKDDDKLVSIIKELI